MVRGASGEHLMAPSPLPTIVGRGVDVDDQVGTGQCEPAERTARMPDILTDRHADLRVCGFQQQLAAAWLEVTELIEDAVVGQALLAVGVDPLAVVKHGRGVVEVTVAIHKANDRGQAFRPGLQVQQGFAVGLQKGGSEQKVFRRIPGNGQLRECRDVGTGLASLIEQSPDPLDVPLEIADCRIELRQRNSNPTQDPPIRRRPPKSMASGKEP